MQIRAKYYSAGSTQTQRITLTLHGDRLLGDALQSHSNLFNEELTAIKVTDELANLPTELLFANGSKVEYVNEPEFDRSLRKQLTGSSTSLAFLEKSKMAWLVCAILVPISLFIFIKVIIPSSARAVVKLIPPNMVENIDQQVLNVIDDELISQSTTSEQVQQQVQRHWQGLLNRLPLNDYNYQLLFRGGERYGANAFALPGGTIVVTDELVALFEKNPDALMAILLHEIGHVEKQHSMQIMTETLGTSLLFTYFLGDIQGMAEFANASVVTLIQNDYSRTLEREADDYALMQLTQLNIPIQGFIEAMEGLQKEHDENLKVMKYFSSHPELTRRIEKGKKHQQSL